MTESQDKLTDPEAVVTEFIRASAELRVEDSIALMADDCECWFTGVGSVPREAFVNGMRALLGAVTAPGPVIINDIMSDGERVAVEYENKLPLNNGKLYHNHYHSKFVVRDGKITVIREYLDSAHVADVLQGINPNEVTAG